MAGKKILVADDSLTIQKVIRLALSGDGYEIQTVSDGKEALEQISLFRPDVAIVDVSLPGHDAYELREKFLQKADLKSIPIILMSSAFEKVDESRSQKLGFSGHLVKPFDPSHLRSTLLSVLQNAPARDPIVETINEALPEKTIDFNTSPSSGAPVIFPELETPVSAAPIFDDVPKLTQDTFEMKSQEWGMFEPGKENPIFSDDFHLETPPTSASEPTSSFSRDMGSFDPHSSLEVQEVRLDSFQEKPFFEDAPQANFSAATAHRTAAPIQTGPSAHEIESWVKREVQTQIEKIKYELQESIRQEILQLARAELTQTSRSIVPNLAEKAIKEEIHRLLSEPPTA